MLKSLYLLVVNTPDISSASQRNQLLPQTTPLNMSDIPNLICYVAMMIG